MFILTVGFPHPFETETTAQWPHVSSSSSLQVFLGSDHKNHHNHHLLCRPIPFTFNYHGNCCVLEGFLEIITHKYPLLYRAYIGISHRGVRWSVYPTIPWLLLGGGDNPDYNNCLGSCQNTGSRWTMKVKNRFPFKRNKSFTHCEPGLWQPQSIATWAPDPGINEVTTYINGRK